MVDLPSDTEQKTLHRGKFHFIMCYLGLILKSIHLQTEESWQSSKCLTVMC